MGDNQVLYLAGHISHLRALKSNSLPPPQSPLQQQISNDPAKMHSSKSSLIPEDYMWRKDYLDSMRKRAERADGTYNTVPSKAWFQDQEENARRHTSSSAVPTLSDDDFKPVPIVKNIPSIVRVPPTAVNKPLKSAMKKTTAAKKE